MCIRDSYSALVPCVISALVAKGTASYFGIEAETFLLEHLPAFSLKNAVLTALLAILGALVSILFCIVLHQTDHLYKKFFPNRYVRIVTGGCIVIALTLLCGNRDYNGSGVAIIEPVSYTHLDVYKRQTLLHWCTKF